MTTSNEREFLEEDEGNKFLEPTILSPLKITPEKIAAIEGHKLLNK